MRWKEVNLIVENCNLNSQGSITGLNFNLVLGNEVLSQFKLRSKLVLAEKELPNLQLVLTTETQNERSQKMQKRN